MNIILKLDHKIPYCLNCSGLFLLLAEVMCPIIIMWHLVTVVTYLESWQARTSNHIDLSLPTAQHQFYHSHHGQQLKCHICLFCFKCNSCWRRGAWVSRLKWYLWKLYFTASKDPNYGLNLVCVRHARLTRSIFISRQPQTHSKWLQPRDNLIPE